MISCDHHDSIEIVCMYRYAIVLTLKSGEVNEGRALDTARDETGQECIELEVESVRRLVVLDNLASLAVSVDNPHLRSILFS